MNRHMPSGRRGLGLGLALMTALLWGTMPVVLKILVGWLDVYTLTWARFVIAGILILPIVVRRHGWRSILAAARRPVLILTCATGLTGNYLFYQSGLRFISPDTAQIVVQLSPVFVLIGGLLIFKETFGWLQWIGFALLITGMTLFLNPYYEKLVRDLDQYALGVLLVVISALLWAGYMLAQKQLLAAMAPETILLIIYVLSAVVLAPWTRVGELPLLETHQLVLLVGVALMTAVSYLSFGAAMNHVEASRLGVVVALTPLLTVAVTAAAASLFPETLVSPRLNVFSVLGAGVVVIGSMLSAVAQARPIRRN